MNELFASQIDINNKRRVNSTFWLFMSLFFLLPLLLNNLAIIPLYSSLEANVSYSGSLLTVFIKYIQDFIDLFAFTSAYAMIIFSSLILRGAKTRFVVIFYAITYFLLIPLKILMNAVIYGSVGRPEEVFVDLIYLTVYFALFLLQLLAVYIFATTDSSRYLSSLEALEGARNQKSRMLTSARSAILPFSSFFNWYNPLQRSAIKVSALITAIKIGTRIVNDISFGAPESFGEIMIMAVYYLSDLLYGAVAYVVALFVIHLLYEKLKKKDGDVSPSVEDKA